MEAILPNTRNANVILVGNPNSGKSTIFNLLTGLRQKVGNFPGVTVDKKTGVCQIPGSRDVNIVDFPGTYSLYPTAKDERIVAQYLSDPTITKETDLVLYIADVTQLEKHLLLFTQILDLNIPVILGLNMTDIAMENQWMLDSGYLEEKLQVPVIQISGKTGAGVAALKMRIAEVINTQNNKERIQKKPFYDFSHAEKEVIESIKKTNPNLGDYQALLKAHHYDWLESDNDQFSKNDIKARIDKVGFKSLPSQINETMARFNKFVPIAKRTVGTESRMKELSITDRIDSVLTHRFFGPIIFFVIMMFIFQSIFTWAGPLMDGIETIFGWLSIGIRNTFPAGWLTDLVVDGIIAGIGGVVIFVPQIAILFLLISLLEEVGYMARAVSMFDHTMQRFGLNGRSIVALVSSGACAIPAIMSTRSISNRKERLITILVTPFISCSARLPVYAILIAFVVPPERVLGIFNMQGLTFMGLYLLGIIAALGSAFILKLILKSDEKSYLLMELPVYRLPAFKSIFLTVYEKVKTFVIEAGKVIFFISIILWFLASFGPGNSLQEAETLAINTANQKGLNEDDTDNLVASYKLEYSYAGKLGKLIEPAIEPLGYDWKIGIALITSFAAREVFVGTMATIYSIGSSDDESTIQEKMAAEINQKTGQPVYTMATALSLLIFYVFAMQCMSTLAVVKRETKSWKWPALQFVFMSLVAYLSSFLVYQIFS